MLSFVPGSEPRKPIRPSEAVLSICGALPEGDERFQAAQRVLFQALSASKVIAHIHLVTGDRWYRIPWEYWQVSDFWDLRLSDRLFSLGDWGVPTELENNDVVVDGDQVDSLIRSLRQQRPQQPTISLEALQTFLRQRPELEQLDVERSLWSEVKSHFAGKAVPKRMLRQAATNVWGARPRGRRRQCATK